MIAEYERSSSSSMSSNDSVHSNGALYSWPVKVIDGLPHSRQEVDLGPLLGEPEW